jgi:hypothetical protein
MRISHILVVALFGLPLGGCPQPLPDWAMNPQAQYHARLTEPTPGVPRNPRRIARRHGPHALPAADNALVTGGTGAGARPAVRAWPAAGADEPKPFTPGWKPREDDRDESLHRTLNICRQC